MNRVMAIPVPSAAELSAEIDRFESEAHRFLNGELDPDVFKRFRLKQGIYGQRQPGVQMVRIKIPFGELTPAQMRAIAQISEEESTGVCHVTTRQDIQLHFVKLERVAPLLRRLADVGLTTREACGNTVRNVTACPMAGACRDELFDITPYAMAVAQFFLRNPICEELPRKFKVALSACPHDCAMTGIHDFGVTAASNSTNGSEALGFRITVGGGLGPTPKRPYLLEEFLSPDDLLPCCEAVIRVFSRYGNRKNRSTARIKFLLEKIGFEQFYRLYRKEFERITRERPSMLPVELRQIQPPPAAAPPAAIPPPATPDARWPDWQRTTVQPQRQADRHAVLIRLIIGDIAAPTFRTLADVVDRFAQGRLRITPQQNLLLRDIATADLSGLYATLSALDLALPAAERIGDVVACPGTDSCGLGITGSKGLGRVLTEQLRAESELDDDLEGITIKVSGCPNSCAQHHIASIGFHGVAHKIDGRLLPAYQIHLGGRVSPEVVRFGQMLPLRFPAKRVPGVVRHLIAMYRTGRQTGESFLAFVDRTGKAAFQQALAPFTRPAEDGTEDDIFHDWGTDGEYSLSEIGQGECAAPTINVVSQHFEDAGYELAHARVLLEKQRPFDAVTRTDLALVASAKALLAMEEIEPLSHDEVLREFEARIVAQRRISPALWSAAIAWYNDVWPTPLTVEAARERVEAVSALADGCRIYYEQTTGDALATPTAMIPQESPAD